MGPIPVGINKFVFEAGPPDTKRIPIDELLGVTVILLTCSYDGREFVRVGYYVNNEYDDEELANDPPAKPVIEKIRRNVLAEKPRVTRFAIKWYVCFCFFLRYMPFHGSSPPLTAFLFPLSRDSEASAPAEFPPEQPEADLVADEEEYGAEELAEEEEEIAANGEESADKDAQMDGIEGAEGEGENGVDEDEMSDEGSVDIEDESEEELLEEEEAGEVEGGEGDEMEVDKPEAAAGAFKQEEAMVH